MKSKTLQQTYKVFPVTPTLKLSIDHLPAVSKIKGHLG